MDTNFFQNKKLKRYSRTMLLSGSSLMLTGCFSPIFDEIPPDYHYGTDGDDILIGSNNIDIFFGSLGADSMDGVIPGNLLNYSKSPSAVNIDLNGGVGKGGHAEGDTAININSLIGSDFDDALIGNEFRNDFSGGKGADAIDGKAGIDIVKYYDSRAGTAIEVNLTTGIGKGGDAQGDTYANIENIQGTIQQDTLIGNEFDNYINGSGGGDTIKGMAGDDILFGGGENALIYGGDGNDLIEGERGAMLYGENGDDSFSSQYNVQIFGGNGEDTAKLFSVNSIHFEILKTDGKISITIGQKDSFRSFTNTLNSVEKYLFTTNNPEDTQYFDIKDIWSELAAEQAKFNDEADFLNWLGDDAGYNYEGL